MSTPVELVVYLAADSPLVSMHARPLTFIEGEMGKRPERRKEGGATFGTFRFLCGSKTGWLYMPHPGLLDDVARVQYFKDLREAKPGLDQVASERLGLEKLVWEYAETRRLQDLNKEAVRLAGLPQPTEPTEVQPPVPLHPGDVYQGEWYQLAGEDDGEAVRIISARNADGSWQARSPATPCESLPRVLTLCCHAAGLHEAAQDHQGRARQAGAPHIADRPMHLHLHQGGRRV